MATDLSTLVVKLSMTSAGFDAGAAKAGKSADTLQAKLASFATAAVGIGAGIAAGLATGKAVSDFANYEQGLANIRASANLTTGQLNQVSAAALKLSADTGKGPTEIASGMNELLKAGLSVDQVLGGAAETVTKFSKVAGMGTGESATVINDALNTFSKDGLTAASAADIVSKAADASSISVEQVAQAFSQTSAVAALAGQSMRDTANAIAILGNNGVKGSDAGTSLKTMLVSLLAPTESAAGTIAELGLSFRDATGQIKPFRGIVAELQRGLGGLGIADQQGALKNLFGTDALRAGAILLKEGVKGWDSFNGKIDQSLGINAKYALMMDTTTGSMEAAKAAAERLGIAVGSLVAGPVTKAINFASRAAELAVSISTATGGIAGDTVKYAAAVVAGVVAAAAFVKIAGLIVRAYEAITKAQAVALALSGPKGWAALAAGGVVAVGTLAILSGAFDKVADSAGEAAKAAAAATAAATAPPAATGRSAVADSSFQGDARSAELSIAMKNAQRDFAAANPKDVGNWNNLKAAADNATKAYEGYRDAQRPTIVAVAQSAEAVRELEKDQTEQAAASFAARKAAADNAAEIQKDVDDYARQAQQVGLSAEAVELHKLALRGATYEQLQAARAALSYKSAMEGVKKQDDEARSIIKGLEDRAAAAQHAGTNFELYKLQQLGASEADIGRASALTILADALEVEKHKAEQLKDSAKSIAEAVRTPWQRLTDEVATAAEAQAAGLLTVEQAALAAKRSLTEALKIGGAGTGGSVRTDAVEMRFTSGFRQEKKDDWQDKLLEFIAAGNTLSKDLKKYLKAIADRPELIAHLGPN